MNTKSECARSIRIGNLRFPLSNTEWKYQQEHGTLDAIELGAAQCFAENQCLLNEIFKPKVAQDSLFPMLLDYDRNAKMLERWVAEHLRDYDYTYLRRIADLLESISTVWPEGADAPEPDHLKSLPRALATHVAIEYRRAEGVYPDESLLRTLHWAARVAFDRCQSGHGTVTGRDLMDEYDRVGGQTMQGNPNFSRNVAAKILNGAIERRDPGRLNNPQRPSESHFEFIASLRPGMLRREAIRAYSATDR